MTWPDPEPTIRPPEVVSRPIPRLSAGFRWSLLVAEMDADEAKRTEDIPNPWTPDDPSGEAA